MVTSVVEEQLEFINPWRCDECNALMYNKTADGYPAPGAPIGYNLTCDETKRRVCTVCLTMWMIAADNEFFRGEHNRWVAERDSKKGLRPGGNYTGTDRD